MIYSGFDDMSLVDIFKKMFEPENPNKLLVNGVKKKDIEMINIALSKGANPDAPLYSRVGVPVIYFVEDQSIIEALLDGGASVRVAEYYEKLGRKDLAAIVYEWKHRQKPKEEEQISCRFDLNF